MSDMKLVVTPKRRSNTVTVHEAQSLQELLDALSEYMVATKTEWTGLARLKLRRKYDELQDKLNSRSEDNARKKPSARSPRTKRQTTYAKLLKAERKGSHLQLELEGENGSRVLLRITDGDHLLHDALRQLPVRDRVLSSYNPCKSCGLELAACRRNRHVSGKDDHQYTPSITEEGAPVYIYEPCGVCGLQPGADAHKTKNLNTHFYSPSSELHSNVG